MMKKELNYIEEAARELKRYGLVYIGYITAEIEPYSSQQRPDISFIPHSGPNADEVFFIELRLFDNNIPKSYLDALSEHYNYAQDSAEHEFAGYAFATNVSLSQNYINKLNDMGIYYLGSIDSGVDLSKKILEWTSQPI